MSCCFYDWRENYMADCYYYSEDKDMGASIPWCSHKHCILNDGDCVKSCERYISRKEAAEVIRRCVGNKEKQT